MNTVTILALAVVDLSVWAHNILLIIAMKGTL